MIGLFGSRLLIDDQFSPSGFLTGFSGAIPVMMAIYVGLVVLAQSVLRVAMMKEECKSMGNLAHQFKCFVFFVVETVLVIQINVISSQLSPQS